MLRAQVQIRLQQSRKEWKEWEEWKNKNHRGGKCSMTTEPFTCSKYFE